MSSNNVNPKKWQQISSQHFRQVAEEYDAGRAFERGSFWAKEIAAQVPLSSEDWLLDLGCGTGLFSLPFAELLPCTIVGVDLSRAMLEAAMAKTNGTVAHWLQGPGEALPFPDNSFQAIFLSQVWHHLSDEAIAAAEFHRILKPGGGLFVKTYAHEQLHTRWDLTTVFPELLPFMLNIYPDIPDFNNLLSQIGFDKVNHKTFQKQDTLRPSELLKVAEGRLWSMFSYLSEEGHRAGIDHLQQLIIEKDDAPMPYDEMHLLVFAQK